MPTPEKLKLKHIYKSYVVLLSVYAIHLTYWKHLLNILSAVSVSERSQVDQVPMKDLLILNTLLIPSLSLIILNGLNEMSIFIENFLDLSWIGRRVPHPTAGSWTKSTH